ncbi:MAG: LPS assembly lipoprotein LptE [Desulfobacterales bacterium]|nr:LPS assembly lipoprotein LptE [Desulfobacterales bacterium]
MHNRHLAFLILLLVPLLLFSGCGYRNPYLGSGDFSRSWQTLHLPVWANRTNQLGLESTFQRSLHGWFKRASRIQIVPPGDNADLVLEGEILAISLPGAAFDANNQAREVSATLVVRYALRDAGSGAILWQEDRQPLNRSYAIGATPAATLDNRRNALAILADELAERIYERTMDTVVQRTDDRGQRTEN